ncbi:hypothetical protein C3B51_04000 [Pseudoalteromonas rubra]|uniref:Carrier domain-containing protein n=1 Tax=Pseudoalteromonas rubra TaxID=43658 RepID=A0A4Q7EJP2_9GAMM|nr:non-ribosomal peptide synthetase [Pseudoalteromonas rubra]RZM84280.1 hypothetical protein C3B51_04000 [Pseudoalteromonas rubra]
MGIMQGIYQMNARGIHLYLDNDKLKTSARQGAITAQDAEFIRGNKSAIITYLTQKARYDDALEQLGTVHSGAEIPLSAAQQRLWFAYQSDPLSCSYNICHAVQLGEGVALSDIETAISMLLARHPVLRTVLCNHNGQGYQRVQPATAIEITVQAISSDELQQHIAQQWQIPFKLEAEPPFRVQCVQDEHGRRVLLYSFHHIAVDGVSADIFLREFAQLYTSLRADQSMPQLPQTLPYSDFASWEAHHREAGTFTYQLDFWQQTLQGVAAKPAGFSVSPCDSDALLNASEYSLEIAPEIFAALQDKAIEHHASPFMITLAALYVLLHRYSGEQDLVIGTAHANRPSRQLDQTLGFFVNMLPLRLDMSQHSHSHSLIESVRAQVVQAFEHHAAPFDEIINRCGLANGQVTNPLFEVCIAYQNGNDRDYAAQGSDFTVLPNPAEQLRFPIQFTFYPKGEALSLVIEYSHKLFSAQQIAQLGDSYTRILSALCLSQDTDLTQLSLVDDAQQTYFAAQHQHQPDTIVGFVTRACETFPARLAVVDSHANETLTYAELQQQVDAFAQQLLDCQVQPGQRVAICLPRSCDLIVAILATLRIGCCYVPIDPSVPAQRRDYILEDTSPAAIICSEQTQPQDLNGVRSILIEHRQQEAKMPLQARFSPAPDDLAYIIYTSGSTGQPKGVQVSHRNVARLFSACEAHYDFSEQDVWCLFHSYGFDFSVWEIFGALRYGARLEIVDADVAKDSARFIALLQVRGVTVLNQTPSAFRQVINQLTPTQGSALSLRHVIFGGEKLHPQWLQGWYDKVPGSQVQFHNMYGITETTVHVSYQQVSKALIEQGTSAIGYALNDLEILLLDVQGQPAAPYAVGEAYIGGGGVTQGYFGQPEKTAQRFVPAPGYCQSKILYRSGDLMMYDPEVGLVYCQRNDNQVQLRGFRIELDEIATQLRAHEWVQDAEVRLWQREADEALVAYIIPVRTGDQSDEQLTEQLKAALAKTLPAYMQPHYYQTLGAWPLTDNGKLDERALPLPRSSTRRQDQCPPITPSEQKLHAIWCQLLELEEVGCEDNFFAVGGHSLLATRLAAQIEQQFSQLLGLDVLLKLGTIRSIAAQLDRQQGNVQRIEPAPQLDSYPLSYAQQRLWVVDQHLIRRSVYNMPVAFRIPKTMDLDKLAQAFQWLVDRHPVLRTYFELEEQGPRQKIAAQYTAHFEHLQVDNDAQLEAHMAQQINTPFALDTLPLFRVTVYHLPQAAPQILLNMHHIISDGWSIQTMCEQWFDGYQHVCDGRALNPINADLAYHDYAYWQRDKAHQASWLDALATLKTRLSELAPCHALPLDKPRPEQPSGRGQVLLKALPASLAKQLKITASHYQCNLLQLFYSAFALVMRSANRAQPLVIGMPASDRERAGLQNTLGYFVNSVPLCCDTELQVSAEQWLREQQSRVLDAIKCTKVPFDWLLDELHIERSMRYHPLFQLLFSYQVVNPDSDGFVQQGIEGVAVPWQSAKFDLNLEVVEQQGEAAAFWLKWEFSTDIFNAQRIEQWHAHLLDALAYFAQSTNASQSLSALTQPWSVDAKAIVDRTARPTFSGLFERFSDMAQRHATRPAIIQKGQTLSYAQLHQDVMQLAGHLTGEQLVAGGRLLFSVDDRYQGICLMLACIALGVTFAPLDTSWPEHRFQQVKAQFQPDLEVRNDTLVERQFWCVQTQRPSASANAVTPLGKSADDHPVSCMFTSGTTGVAKGVLIPENAILRLVVGSDYVPLNTETCMLQMSSLGFDAATFEVFGPLLNGGSLVLYQELGDYLQGIDALLSRHEINTCWMTAGLFKYWSERLSGPTALRYLLVGGDVVAPNAVQAVYQQDPKIQIINGYGPTENTTFSTTYAIEREIDPSLPIAIGQCVTGSSCVVVDEQGQILTKGQTGELLVGGYGLALGYLNDPQLNESKFVSVAGLAGRFYATGDRVYMDGAGCLHYCGRTDNLIKVNGYRVDLLDIETNLTQLEGVQSAVVVVNGTDSANKVLAAAVLGEHTLIMTELEATLREKLPHYMIPSRILQLPEFPLNPNGKFDRQAIAKILAQSQSTLTEPLQCTDTLSSLLGILADMGVDNLDVEENFFNQGGNSLLAIRFCNAIEERLGMPVSVSVIYQNPTLSALATYLNLIEQSSSPTEAMERDDVIDIVI